MNEQNQDHHLKMYKKSDAVVVEKFRKVSNTVWGSFEAVVVENTLKEE
jgi:hypothetical protein